MLDQLKPAHQVLALDLVPHRLDRLGRHAVLDVLATHEQKASWPSDARAVLRSHTLKSDALLVNDTVLPLMAMPQCRFFSSLLILPLPDGESETGAVGERRR